MQSGCAEGRDPGSARLYRPYRASDDGRFRRLTQGSEDSALGYHLAALSGLRMIIETGVDPDLVSQVVALPLIR